MRAWARTLNAWYSTGVEALDYFHESNPDAEKMQAGSNEAEWIMDLTTHADRDDKCALRANATQSVFLRRLTRAEITALDYVDILYPRVLSPI